MSRVLINYTWSIGIKCAKIEKRVALVLKNFNLMNQAMLAKQFWRIS